MKASRIASWIFESFAASLAVYSLYIVLWMLREVVSDIAEHPLRAGPGGMPGNASAGVGIAIWLGSGVLAAVLAYVIAVAAAPFDRSAAALRFSKLIQRSAIVGAIAPFAIFAIGLLIE